MRLPRTTWLPAFLLGAGLAATLAASYFLHRLLDHFTRVHHASELAVAGHWPVPLVLAGGIALSWLLASQVRLLGQRHDDARRLAEGMTADLRARERELREQQRRLAESERRWQFALQGAELGVWERDLGTGTDYLSPRWREITGIAEGAPPPGLESWLDWLHPDDRGVVAERMRAVVEEGVDSFASEYRLRQPDGSHRWVLDRGIVVARDGTGRPLRLVGTLVDIEARKQRELERDDYLRFFRLATEPMCIMSLEGALRAANAAMAALLGYREEELRGRAPAELVHPDDLARTREGLERYLAGAEGVELENRLRHRDGHYVRLAWKAFLDRDNSLLYCTVRDVSAMHEARVRLERLDKLYAALGACNAALVHCESEDELFAEVTSLLVRFGGVSMAWLARVDGSTRELRPLRVAGAGAAELEALVLGADPQRPEGRHALALAVADHRPRWPDDAAAAPRPPAWREVARREGWQASAVLPLACEGEVVAVLALESADAAYFDDEARRLLLELSADLGFALEKFAAAAELEASRASLVEAEQRFQAIVGQSLAGAFIIQDGVLVYANPRLEEILGVTAGGTLVGRSPLDIVAPRDRARIGENLRRLMAGEIPESESVFTALRADGTTVEVGTHSFIATYRGRVAVIGMGQDLADRKVAERQVQRYAERLEQLLEQTVGLATTISEMRDPYTAGHERRVAEIAIAIGAELGLDEERLHGLRIGAWLHDVGKIRLPTEILSKPGRLTPIEYRLIQQHPRDGYEVLKDVDFPWPVAQVALQHHERWDGSGYPQGLAGEAILLEARIVAVADVIESMASHRPYRPAIGLEAALAEVEAGSGTRYDPAVVAACLRLFRDKGFQVAA